MIPSFLTEKQKLNIDDKKLKTSSNFIDKTIKNAAHIIFNTMQHFIFSQKKGLLQSIDARVKVFFLFLGIIFISIIHSPALQLIISGCILLLYILSDINIINVYKKIIIISFFFGFIVFIPASLNVFTEGKPIITLFNFNKELNWWIYKVPSKIFISYEGILITFKFTLKVINSISLTLLIAYTTTFEIIVKALSFYKIPSIFLMTLTMSYKFIFILSKTIIETYNSLKMRWWNYKKIIEAEEIVAGRINYIFRKSWQKYERLYDAMLLRGFDGNINIYYFKKLSKKDYLFLIIFILFLISIYYISIFYV
jgi:cobalt ECF transporter T component CbiQ